AGGRAHEAALPRCRARAGRLRPRACRPVPDAAPDGVAVGRFAARLAAPVRGAPGLEPAAACPGGPLFSSSPGPRDAAMRILLAARRAFAYSPPRATPSQRGARHLKGWNHDDDSP